MGRNFNMMMKKCCKIVSFISAISLLCSCGNNIGGDGTYSFNKNITDEVKYSSFYGESDIISDNDYKERYAKILEEYDPENVVDTAFTFNGWQF